MERSNGFTIIEILVVISIMAILAALAAPSFRDYIDKSHVRGAAEAVYEQLQYARSQSLKRSVPIIVDFSANNNTTWALGMTDDSDGTTGCDAAISSISAGACTLEYDNDTATDFDGDGILTDSVLMRVESADFSNVTMKGSTGNSPSFTGAPGSCITANSEEACFEPIRGLARETKKTDPTDHIELQKGDYKLQVIVDCAGGAKICVPDGAEYFAGYLNCSDINDPCP